MSSEGSREIEAARKRLAAAKAQASSTAKSLKSAKAAEDAAKKMRQWHKRPDKMSNCKCSAVRKK